jgi:hypothetical protein
MMSFHVAFFHRTPLALVSIFLFSNLKAVLAGLSLAQRTLKSTLERPNKSITIEETATTYH